MKVMTIMGTRPEMIKMWSVLKKLDESDFDHVMVHTGQNYTPELKDFFFNDLKLRKPDHNLSIDVQSYGTEVADVIKKSEESQIEEEIPLYEEEVYQPEENYPVEEEKYPIEEEELIKNCNGPLKELDNVIPKAPEPVDHSQSECMELDNQDTIIHEMLDWGDDDYPNPSYQYNKFCTD